LQQGREDYFVHLRRSFFETFKDDGLIAAVEGVFEHYQQDEAVFNILDEATGQILPLEKFFQFSLRRSGTMTPTSNVVKAFLVYARTFERKVSLDELLPKLDIYAQSLTPREYTPRGLEVDRTLKTFFNKYMNNKKGRQIDLGFVKQGDKIDMGIRALRTLTSLLDIAFSIPIGVMSNVGERGANLQLLGKKWFVLGTKRQHTAQGKAIIKKYEVFTGRPVWKEVTAPGKEIGERVMQGLYGLFHEAWRTANQQYLLGSLTKEEFEAGVISDKRLAELRVELGRWRVVPEGKSLVGSTAAGQASIQYKAWAVPMARTILKDVTTLMRDLKTKPIKDTATSREARELYRLLYVMAAVLIFLGIGDEEDRSFVGQLSYKLRSESLSMISAISPEMWLATPRILGFLTQLGKNVQSLILLEEYKTKPGLKGVEGLKKQFTPAPIRNLQEEGARK